MKVAVIGAGSFGTTLAQVFSKDARQVTLWTRDSAVADHINAKHAHPTRFTDVTLDDNVGASIDLKEALKGAHVVVSALPMKALRHGTEACNPYIESGAIFVSTTKGIEAETRLFPHQILSQTLTKHDEQRRAYLSGPNFASEIIRGLLWAAVVGSKSKETSKNLQQILRSSKLRVYTSTDVVGVELGGALKNVFAIASGIVDGCGLGQNARAALITRGLNEMSSFGHAFGAKPKTLYGLSGLGDLLLSCTSSQSRNWRVGNGLALGQTAKEIEAELGEVAEGIGTTAAAVAIASELKIEAPICNAVNGVIHGTLSLKEAIAALMNRQVSEE
jgi:glycerol-3-phosphate dehydrogenase (NAD(P)+)